MNEMESHDEKWLLLQINLLLPLMVVQIAFLIFAYTS
jgi:hypothetical protein